MRRAPLPSLLAAAITLAAGSAHADPPDLPLADPSPPPGVDLTPPLLDPAALPVEPSPPPVTNSPSTPVAATPRGRRWYGWQILVGQAALTGIVFAGVATKAAPVAWVSLMSTPFVGTVVHNLHRDPVKGFISLGMNLAGGAAGALIAGAVGHCRRNVIPANCLEGVAFAGGFIGVQGAALIDALTLAWDKPKAPAWTAQKFQITPTFGAVPGGSMAGIAASF